ncbi:MAG: radical SAM protein [Candidatus Pacebacteria bacterium]|nr:radical SAM protein [Candidatus Paceibacterota bacterium]
MKSNKNRKLNKFKLEIDILDFCNLNCDLCARGIPLQKDKRFTYYNEIEEISKIIKPYEFNTIKIGGGEPTMHPEFSKICQNLKRLFPAKSYYLATNGFKLENFLDEIKVFDTIELSQYPGKNDEVFDKIAEMNLSNVIPVRKEDYTELEDIYRENNLNKKNIYNRCIYKEVTHIVGGRIYPCCNIFGQAMRQNIDLNNISVLADENWRENLKKIDIETYCRRCFVKVPSYFNIALYKTLIGTGRFIKQNIRPLKKYIFKNQIKRQIKKTNASNKNI